MLTMARLRTSSIAIRVGNGMCWHRVRRMTNNAFRSVCFLCLAQILFAICTSCESRSTGAGMNNSAAVPVASQSPPTNNIGSPPPQVPAGSPPAQSSSPIRGVDFKNFTYPWYPTDYPPPHAKREIKLHDGEMKVDAVKNIDRIWARLANVSYADLTGDGSEEAIVTVVTNFDPNGSVACIFIYRLRNGEPRLWWSHETGDRANGGLRSLRVEGYNLVVEHYEIQFDWAKGRYEDGAALCCPKRFVRSSYRWNGEKFEKTKSETLPNEYKSAEFLGYPSDQSAMGTSK